MRLLLAVAALLCMTTAARAAEQNVRDRLCYAVTDTVPSDSLILAQPYACGGEPSGYRDRWLWLKVDDPTALRAMPPRWHLLTDQARFGSVRVIVRRADGTRVDMLRSGDDMRRNWALGGHLRFDIPAGSKPTDVIVGFERLDSFDTMRKFRLTPPEALEARQRSWLLIMGVFGGAVGASLIYAVALYAGLGNALRVFYSAWAVAMLLYGFLWTNIAYYLFPDLAGTVGARLNVWAVALTASLGLVFFRLFVEADKLSARFRRFAFGYAVAMFGIGALGSFERIVDPGLFDTLFNAAMLGGVALIGLGCAKAILGGSRSAKFYLLAWSVPLFVLMMRILANFGVAKQSELLDLATFGSMAVQAVLLSIGIGDRFRNLQAERDRAAQALGAAEAESEAMRLLAETDTLTGLFNRRGFVARAPEMIGRHGMLALIDLDHFKSVNDSFGHDVGDIVLTRVAEVLRAAAGPEGIAGRLGGEEFGIIGPLASAEAARVAVAAMNVADILGPGRTLTISIGVATGATAYERFYVAADRALYRAKEDGRNRVIVTGTEDRPVRLVRSNAVPLVGPQAG